MQEKNIFQTVPENEKHGLSRAFVDLAWLCSHNFGVQTCTFESFLLLKGVSGSNVSWLNAFTRWYFLKTSEIFVTMGSFALVYFNEHRSYSTVPVASLKS